MTVLAAVATAALLSNSGAAQSRIPLPPATELAERSDALLQRVAEASRPEGQDVESAVARIDAVVAHTSRQYGGNSIESIQVATEAGIALIRDWQRFDLARPHIERSLLLSRAVFGTDHRETAFAIQDVAVVRQELRPELFSFPVGRHLLFYRPQPGGIVLVRVLHGARDLPALFSATEH